MATNPNVVTRPLGRNGPQVSRLGVGLMLISGHYSLPAPEEEQLAFLDKIYEMGERFWDTSDAYGNCEEVIGKWFAANPEKRKDVFLATKFGLASDMGGADASPENALRSIDKSLKRLGVPFVDLYYLHHLDKVTPIEKTMQALVQIKNAGKIKHIGLCECSAKTLRRAYAVHPVLCVQMEYNLFTLDLEAPQLHFLETIRELGVGLVCFSPLGRGILTGNITSAEDVKKEGDVRSHLPRYQAEHIDQNVAVVRRINDMAKSKGVSASQLALAWLLAQGDDIFAIPGTTKPHRVAENMAAMKITLTADEEKHLREIAKGVSGDRIDANWPGVNFHGDTPEL